jgi:hypothetical protein
VDALTEDERRVLNALGEVGLVTSYTVAEHVGLPADQVREQIESLLHKLQAHNREELVEMGRR